MGRVVLDMRGPIPFGNGVKNHGSVNDAGDECSDKDDD
jgi:hypothetical protein